LACLKGAIEVHPKQTIRGCILWDYAEEVERGRIHEAIDKKLLDPLPLGASDEDRINHWATFILLPGEYGTEALVIGFACMEGVVADVYEAQGPSACYLPGPDAPPTAPRATLVRIGKQGQNGHYLYAEVR
jgi:hypothetical protein